VVPGEPFAELHRSGHYAARRGAVIDPAWIR
jgi:hypothetical protein